MKSKMPYKYLILKIKNLINNNNITMKAKITNNNNIIVNNNNYNNNKINQIMKVLLNKSIHPNITTPKIILLKDTIASKILLFYINYYIYKLFINKLIDKNTQISNSIKKQFNTIYLLVINKF